MRLVASPRATVGWSGRSDPPTAQPGHKQCTAAGSFWDSRKTRKYLIGTLDHMRHWPSLPLGWVGRVSRPYTGLPDHAYALVARGEIKRNHPRGYTRRNSQRSATWDFFQVIPRMVCNPAGASRPPLPICNQSTYIRSDFRSGWWREEYLKLS